MDGPRTRKVMKRAKRVSLTDSGRAANYDGGEEGEESEFD